MTTAAAPIRITEPPMLTVAPHGRWKRQRLSAVAVLAWLATGIYIVPADQQAVVTRFGRVSEPRVMPGLHISLPWPIDRVSRLKVQQLQRAVIGGDAADQVLGRYDPSRSQFLTGDQNLIHVRTVVQYSVGVPADYLFRAQDVGGVVERVVEAELARAIANLNVDAILTTGKAVLQAAVRSAAQQRLDEYGTGTVLANVNIESVTPPPEAADSFRDVASARADLSRIVNEAQGYANDIVPRARGEARQLIEAAKSHQTHVTNKARGDTMRFMQVAAEYTKASEVNGRRLYIETLEQVLPRIRKVFVNRNGNLDLTVIRESEPAAK
ncbi:MAG: FtsH protease activity modulator HflK [Bryobacteraceae bacterium]